MDNAAYLSEVFSSVQGEGPYVGYRQIFVRFLDCNLNCDYCDTENNRAKVPKCSIEKRPGTSRFQLFDNPVSLGVLNQAVDSLKEISSHQGLSLTGGEPLMHVDFLKKFLPGLQGQFSIYLETNGTLPEALLQIMEMIDIIAMDIKLPSSTKTKPLWEKHHRFLELAATREAFVKTIVSAETKDEDFMSAIEMISAVDSRIPLIIQPVTVLNGKSKPPKPIRIMELQSLALSKLITARIIPQSHRMMEML